MKKDHAPSIKGFILTLPAVTKPFICLATNAMKPHLQYQFLFVFKYLWKDLLN